MALLSNQLRNIANQAKDAAAQQAGVAQAQLGMQAGQAVQQAGAMPLKGAKGTAQQLAAGVTQQQQGIQTQQMAQTGQAMAQLGQQGIQQQAQAGQLKLQEQQMLNDREISELQRQGQLRQNSAQLNSSKKLQDNELQLAQRMTSAKLAYDNNLSFLTRKQREDLASIDRYAKQQIFDQRLMFEQAEGKRKFSNSRQLADYAVLSAKDDLELKQRMQDMQQASAKELLALQHAHDMLVSKIKLEFQREEKQKDYALLKKLTEYKNAIDKKMRRKAAQSGAITNIIVGGATIAGAVAGTAIGAASGNPYGAYIGGSMGAQAGSSLGKLTSGTLQSSGVY